MNFKRMTLDSIPEIERFYTMRGNKACDCSVVDAYLWKDFYHVEYSIWESRALLSQMNFYGEKYVSIPYCKAEDLPDAFHALERYVEEELGLPFEINLVDENSVRILDLPKELYEVSEMEDERDYLYSRESLVELKGSGLSDKRANIGRFLQKYGTRYEYRTITGENWRDAWEFLKLWLESRDEECDETLAAEIDGIYEILTHIESLPVRSGMIYVDGDVEAFSLGAYNPLEKMAIISVEKANAAIPGMYQFINQQFLLHAYPDAELVNREDDLGLPGLRTVKMSYEPIGFAKKFRIKKRQMTE